MQEDRYCRHSETGIVLNLCVLRLSSVCLQPISAMSSVHLKSIFSLSSVSLHGIFSPSSSSSRAFPVVWGCRKDIEYQSSTLSCPVRPPPITPYFPYLFYTRLSIWFSIFLSVSSVHRQMKWPSYLYLH